VEPVGATTPPEVVLPVVAPLEGGGVAVPPFVEPVLGVVLAGALVVELEEVVLARVELVEEVVAEELLVVDPVDPVTPVDPVAPVAPVELVAPALSSALFSVGSSAGTVAGALSATVVPPQAASATAPRVPPRSASDRGLGVTCSRSKRTHPTPARRAVVEVALGELLTPGAEAQVLHCPRKR
jgi:hypothetical protein